jgi:epoxyqueuosine reductase QueG
MSDSGHFFDDDDSWDDDYHEEGFDDFDDSDELFESAATEDYHHDSDWEDHHGHDDIVEEVRDEFLHAASAGMAFAFAEEIASSRDNNKYDVDENTDAENWMQASRYMATKSSKQPRQSSLQPFEKLVDDICKGRRSFFN